jgi:hypothetical protein
MRGAIEKIWENKTKDDKKYHVLEIGGEKYSVWDSKLLDGIEEGATVDYEWKASGDFKKITGIQKIENDFKPEAYIPDRKSMEIIRMSCLRSASEILHGSTSTPWRRPSRPWR